MNIDFFQRRKTQLEDTLLLKNQAVDMLDYLKTHCINSDQYCTIRDYIEEALRFWRVTSNTQTTSCNPHSDLSMVGATD